MSHFIDTNESVITVNINSDRKLYNVPNTVSGIVIPMNFKLSHDNDYNLLFGVKNARIPISYYNINDNNNTFKYQIDATTYTLTITNKNYSITTFGTYLDTNTPFTFAYDSEISKFTITHATDEFTILSSSSCLKPLGFSSADHTSSGLSLTSNQVVDISYTKNIIIASTSIQTRNLNNTGGSTSYVLTRIPLSVDPGSIQHYEDTDMSIIENRDYNSFDLYILDDDFNEIDLNGVNYTLTLRFAYQQKSIIRETEFMKLRRYIDESKLRSHRNINAEKIPKLKKSTK